MAQYDKTGGKKMIVLAALLGLLGMVVLLLCLGTLSYFGVVEIPFMNSVLQAVGLESAAGKTGGESQQYIQTSEDPDDQGTDPTESTQPHTHAFTQEQMVEATCTQGGYTLMACACGETRQENATQALEHSYESKADDTGKTVYTCTRCQDTYTENADGTDDQPDQKGEPSLNKTDITLTKKGETYTLRLRYKDGEQIENATWISSNPDAVTVENGKVTAVSKGTVTITATFNGKDYTCIVRSRAPEAGDPGNTGGEPADKEDGDISVDIQPDNGNTGGTSGGTPADKEDDDISVPITPPGNGSGQVEDGVIDFDELWGSQG